jgi:hypothetical protein
MLTFRANASSVLKSTGNLRVSNHCQTIDYLQSGVGITPKLLERGAAHLRRAGEAPKRRRGPSQPDFITAAVVDLLVGGLLAPSNSKVVETVRAIRAQHLTTVHFNPLSPATPPEGQVRAAFNSVHALGIHLINRYSAASMLDRVIDAMRDGTFTKWSENDDDVIVEFYPDRLGTIVYFDHSATGVSAVFAFDVDKLAPPPNVQHVIRVRGSVLRGLATALGPLPPTAIPPPPPY